VPLVVKVNVPSSKSSLLMVIRALSAPAATGLKVTLKVVLAAAAIVDETGPVIVNFTFADIITTGGINIYR